MAMSVRKIIWEEFNPLEEENCFSSNILLKDCFSPGELEVLDNVKVERIEVKDLPKAIKLKSEKEIESFRKKNKRPFDLKEYFGGFPRYTILEKGKGENIYYVAVVLHIPSIPKFGLCPEDQLIMLLRNPPPFPDSFPIFRGKLKDCKEILQMTFDDWMHMNDESIPAKERVKNHWQMVEKMRKFKEEREYQGLEIENEE